MAGSSTGRATTCHGSFTDRRGVASPRACCPRQAQSLGLHACAMAQPTGSRVGQTSAFGSIECSVHRVSHQRLTGLSTPHVDQCRASLTGSERSEGADCASVSQSGSGANLRPVITAQRPAQTSGTVKLVCPAMQPRSLATTKRSHLLFRSRYMT